MIASLVALSMRMRWEEVLAFIAGPVFLLALILGGQKVLTNSKSEDAAQQATAIPQNLPLPPSTEEPTNLLTIALLLISVAVLTGLMASRRTIAFELDAYLKRVATKAPHFSKARKRSTEQATTYGALYYETAIRLGVMIAACDGQTSPQTLAVLKRVFNLSEDICPNADTLYQEAVDHPQKMTEIINPFIKKYGARPASSETLIFGMCSIVMASGLPSDRALGMIRMTASSLGLTPGATSRLLMSSGYFGTQSGSGHQQNQSYSTARKSPPTERLKHLQTLGLTGEADTAKIKTTWRRLAARYHPDKLMSQNLPTDELSKAEDLMQSINEAYDWLKEHG